MSAIQNRYEFVYLFDVTNGNPNGDPDAGNMPRLDPETNCGLVSDVCLKRKVRNYIDMARRDSPGHEIYVAERAILNHQHDRAWKDVLPNAPVNERKKLPKEEEKARSLTAWMCANFYDVRTFGAVMTTGSNCGQVRGPVQLAFAHSLEPVVPLEITITRMAVTTEREAEEGGDNRTMGRKHIVPYGLYRGHGFISAKLAEKTGFSEDDLALFWEALRTMFDHDRSAARGEMVARKLFVFKHQSPLGNAPAHTLFDGIWIKRRFEGEEFDPSDRRAHNFPPSRRFNDYAVHALEQSALPSGVKLIEMF